jgi:hypothetical protein
LSSPFWESGLEDQRHWKKIGWWSSTMEVCTSALRRFLLLGAVVLLACFAVSSCAVLSLYDSMFNSHIKVPVAKKTLPEKPLEPPKCELPYCTVDMDYPLELVTRPKLYVQKSERRLLLIQDQVLIREYHIGLGPSPRGDKYFKGDGRTPEEIGRASCRERV